MDASSRVAAIIEPIIEDMGFELVRAKVNNARLPLLQVMAEPVDGRNMDVEDCASLSRAISAVLDVEDPIASAYTLEVSSPGIDRPLTRPKDFDRWKGFEARVEMEDCVKDRKRFTGKLLGLADGNNIEIEVDGEVYELPFDNLLRAKLLLSDELLQSVANEKQT
ncbi:MAG: ribosome maturation factor RimP [Rhodospirillaceae bacterium]|nr:ribosome maturation factor RimP [Rhodospirillaceae bacterium]MCK5166230.1 ribosome maturation factor RimP [Rhodospirillaceae bacterium]